MDFEIRNVRFVSKKKKKKNAFIQQGHIKLIESVTEIYRTFISNKCCSFDPSINQRILKSIKVSKEKKKKKKAAQMFSALIKKMFFEHEISILE